MVFLEAGLQHLFWDCSLRSPPSRLCSTFSREHTWIASELLHQEEDKKQPLSARTTRQQSKNPNILPRVIWSDTEIGQCCPVQEFTAREAPRVEQGWNTSLSQYKIAGCAARDFHKSPIAAVPSLTASPSPFISLHHLIYLFIINLFFIYLFIYWFIIHLFHLHHY